LIKGISIIEMPIIKFPENYPFEQEPSQTIYPDKTLTGSGLDVFKGNKRSEIKNSDDP
jgi:hypothetical protein